MVPATRQANIVHLETPKRNCGEEKKCGSSRHKTFKRPRVESIGCLRTCVWFSCWKSSSSIAAAAEAATVVAVLDASFINAVCCTVNSDRSLLQRLFDRARPATTTLSTPLYQTIIDGSRVIADVLTVTSSASLYSSAAVWPWSKFTRALPPKYNNNYRALLNAIIPKSWLVWKMSCVKNAMPWWFFCSWQQQQTEEQEPQKRNRTE